MPCVSDFDLDVEYAQDGFFWINPFGFNPFDWPGSAGDAGEQKPLRPCAPLAPGGQPIQEDLEIVFRKHSSRNSGALEKFLFIVGRGVRGDSGGSGGSGAGHIFFVDCGESGVGFLPAIHAYGVEGPQ